MGKPKVSGSICVSKMNKGANSLLLFSSCTQTFIPMEIKPTVDIERVHSDSAFYFIYNPPCTDLTMEGGRQK